MFFLLNANESFNATTLSFVFPGGGQFYNGNYIRGTVYAGIELSFGYGIYYSIDKYDEYKDKKKRLDRESLSDSEYNSYLRFYNNQIDKFRKERNNYLWLLGAAVLLSAGDAFVETKFKGFADKIKLGNGFSIIPDFNGLVLKYEF